MTIVREETILGGDPRIDGARIAVHHVYEPAIDGGHAPADVADQLDLSLGDVHEALAYYYNHPEEMREVEGGHADERDTLARQALTPPEPIERRPS
jgi:uncharacterized protein (DUF433 family)